MHVSCTLPSISFHLGAESCPCWCFCVIYSRGRTYKPPKKGSGGPEDDSVRLVERYDARVSIVVANMGFHGDEVQSRTCGVFSGDVYVDRFWHMGLRFTGEQQVTENTCGAP